MLGLTLGEWTAARAALAAFLDANDAAQDVPEAAARATHPAFADDGVWAEAKKALGI